MTATKKGGPAFPQSHTQLGNGMYLRDYFAAKAMAAFLANDTGWIGASGSSPEERIAADAYEMADAMLAARESP